MNLPPNSVLIVFRGRNHVIPCTPDRLEDPAAWVDISGYGIIDDLHSLGRFLPPPKLESPPIRKSLGEILRQPMPEAVPQKDSLLEKFEKKGSLSAKRKSALLGWIAPLGRFFQIRAGPTLNPMKRPIIRPGQKPIEDPVL